MSKSANKIVDIRAESAFGIFGLGIICGAILFASMLIKTDFEGYMSFEVFLGIMLAGITVMLTALAIGIAILTIFGYRNIGRIAQKSAKEASEKEISRMGEDGEFHAMMKEVFEQKLSSGAMNDTIITAVEKLATSGIQGFGNDDLENIDNEYPYEQEE